MRKAQFFYLLRRGLLSGGLNLIKEGLVMASKFTTQGLSFPAQGSAEFNGSSDYIEFPTLFPVDEISVSYWINRGNITGTTNNVNFLLGAGYAGNGFYVEFGSSGKIQIVIGTSVVSSTSLNVGTNQWDYVSMTYDGTNVKLYINGSLESTQSIAITTPTGFSQFGRYRNITPFYKGNVANVAIWNRALTSDEINSVMWKSYEGLTGAESNGLQAWYSLDDITSPAASLANMEQLATDKDATIENKAAITAAINALS